ncbi:zinc finger protein 362-like isoform X4 [Lineus longissimus]|uniref:zinc finger protein 362-like isoform X4 n=1 Tax=Lineus longissimus TaxID=88925 RepID=UPI002B4E29A0
MRGEEYDPDNWWNLYSIMAERRDLYLWDSPDSKMVTNGGNHPGSAPSLHTGQQHCTPLQGSGHTGHTSHNHNMSSPPSQTSNGNAAIRGATYPSTNGNSKWSYPDCDSIFPVPGAFHSRLQGCKDPMPNRVQDLQCGPNQGLPNSFSPPSSIQNNHNQLVVPQPLKPIKTKKSYQCKMCDQMYECKSDLMVHTQQVHKQDPKPYKCPTCSKCFANSSYLSQHARIHSGIKPYQCNFCERRFTQLSHLQQHRRTHTGEKPYKCQHPGCGKAFTQLSNLQTHSRSHMTDKPYRCNSCYKCFVDEIGLREHIPKHSDTKHLKTHICRICGKSYTQETYLTRHMAKHQMDGGSPRIRIPKHEPLNRPIKQEPGTPIESCSSASTPKTPIDSAMNGKSSSAFIPITHPYSHVQPSISNSQAAGSSFPFPPTLQNSPLSSSLPHISCVTSPRYFPAYDPISSHRTDSLDRDLQSRDSSSMIARSLLSLQHIKSYSNFAQCNSGST